MIFTKYTKFLESLKNINDMWNVIPQSVKDLHNLFSEQGKKLYLVGGSVRDFLTGDKPKDFDLATDALPDEVLEIIGDKYKTNLQGKSFGVVVVYTKDQPGGMEIATFREDVYDDKLGKTRNPDVKFTTIDQDVLRRDLRINGLFYDLDKREIVDLVGGIEDIKNKTISMIGDPDLRIKEDPLRILRAIRMACRIQKMATIENKTAESIKRNASLLLSISKERIWEEFCKSYKQSKNFSKYLNYLKEFDLFQFIFPSSKINTEIKDCKFLVTYIANLFYLEAWSNDLENRMVQNYKIEIDTTRKVIFLIRFEDLNETNAFDYYKSKVRCHITDEEILDWLNVRQIDSPIFRKFLKYKPSVSAEDLMKQGYKGKALGDKIKELEIEEFKKI
jgi:tRNA nucleotidyltransferase/poly(A) polymerase